VLPAFNEERNIAPMAAALTKLAKPLGGYEIVFVNDCSTDGTLAAIKELARHDSHIRFVSFVRNFGHHSALRAGLRHARGNSVIVMDCDFEHPPTLIPELVAAWRNGAKVVGTRRTTLPSQLSPLKRLTSRLFYRVFNMLGDVQVEQGSADFMLLDRSVVDMLERFGEQELFLRGMVRWLGVPMIQIPYAQGTRTTGETKFTFKRMLDLAAMGIITHSIRPLRVGLYLSFAFALIGVLLLVYSLVSFLWIGRTVVGWTSEMSAIAILGAGQFLVLGIIGEYVGRLIMQTRGWPLFVIAETEADIAAKHGATANAAPAVNER
jgi:dolichol-phosphate mannosyltransferase